AFVLAAGIVAAGASVPTYHTVAAEETTATDSDTPKAASPKADEQKPTESPKPRSDGLPANGPGAPANALGEQSIRGSGNVITKEMPFADFTTVEISRSFWVEITPADS